MTSHRHPGSGFTLIEVLMVMLVITILYSISLSVIRTVNRSAYRAAACAELKGIESACKQYYAHYLCWPPTGTATASGVEGSDNESRYVIDKTLMEILSGTESSTACNPDKIVFMEFARIDDDGFPLNPWGGSSRFSPKQCRYYVEFDTSELNYIDISHISGVKPTDSTDTTIDTKQRRGVVVWTHNPEISEGKEGHLVGSWLQ